LPGALSSELDQPLSIERASFHAAEHSLERRHHGSFRRGPSNCVQAFIVQLDQIAKRTNVARWRRTWTRQFRDAN
jgi:hypothetical protein